MKIIGTGLVTLILIAGLSGTAIAQTYQSSSQDRYSFCQQNAQRMSGYYGETPGRYREGNAFRKAAKQANAVNAIAFIAGADKKKRKKLRKKAALDGFLKGAIQRGIQEDKQRKSRERYDHELRTCMNVG